MKNERKNIVCQRSKKKISQHTQAHLQIPQADTQPKFAKELAFQSQKSKHNECLLLNMAKFYLQQLFKQVNKQCHCLYIC